MMKCIQSASTGITPANLAAMKTNEQVLGGKSLVSEDYSDDEDIDGEPIDQDDIDGVPCWLF